MRLFASALAVVGWFMLAGTPVFAHPASCDRVLEMLSRGVDPAQVAEDLATTRARVSACAKVERAEDRVAERRAQLHWERHQRGLD